MHPLRISVCTYNLWNTQRWPDREPALGHFLDRFRPDIFCVQELRSETRDCIDTHLEHHARVTDSTVTGWTRESNIWWQTDLFYEIDHGAEDIGHKETNRWLFWVRLGRRDREGTLLVTTCHLTHQRNRRETETGQSPRVEQANRLVAVLDRIAEAGEPVWVTGDFNDPVHVPAILHQAGYTDCYGALAVQPPPTFPARPTSGIQPGEYFTNATFDWIMAGGAVRALCAATPQTYQGDLAPSDHWPVVAIYEVY